MGRAKEIIIKVINSKTAVPFVKKTHYSGTVSNTSRLHFGCFLDGKMHGVMSFGSPMDKSKVLPLVQPCLWNEMLELNRMAFDDYLPKYSESRCIAIAIRLIKKNAPHIKWILSFSDAVQCGDGTIYRASGFNLTNVKKSTQIIETPKGERVTRMTLTQVGNAKRNRILKELGLKDTGASSVNQFLNAGCFNVVGFQNRYIYLINKTCKITVPILPFSEIDKQGAGMYKGEKITLQERKVINLSGEVDSNSNS
tara:strand:+ start:3239 stop:3997 length:759 start_codon:yes stop_codon:yes gene_type:complete